MEAQSRVKSSAAHPSPSHRPLTPSPPKRGLESGLESEYITGNENVSMTSWDESGLGD